MSEKPCFNEAYESVPIRGTFATHTGDLVALGEPGNPSRCIDDPPTVTSRIEDLGELTNPINQLDDD